MIRHLILFLSMATARFSSAFVTPRTFVTQPLRLFASVSGIVYESEDADAPQVRLFTKEGCTLCDKVKDVLMDVRDEFPHNLEQVDITDPENGDWFNKYKYDIPVLHMGKNKFWVKHRIDKDEAKLGLTQAKEGTFVERQGDPDAGAMERRQAERQK